MVLFNGERVLLRFEAHKNLKNVITGECNRIVIYNGAGDPVAFVIQVSDKAYITSNIGNSDFNGLLKALNIDKLNIKHDEQ